MTEAEMEKLAEGVIEAVEALIVKRIASALQLDGRLKDLEVAGQCGPRVESLERRASRQAEHIARLEERIKKLEGR